MMNAREHHDLELRHTAEQHYQRVARAGWLPRLWARLTGRPPSTLPVGAVGPIQQPPARPAVQAVPISQIVGTTRPAARVDGQFRPRHPAARQPWLRLAVAHLRGDAVPPVELVALETGYLVRDGHLRISVARALGQTTVDACVLQAVPVAHPAQAATAATAPAQWQPVPCRDQQHA